MQYECFSRTPAALRRADGAGESHTRHGAAASLRSSSGQRTPSGCLLALLLVSGARLLGGCTEVSVPVKPENAGVESAGESAARGAPLDSGQAVEGPDAAERDQRQTDAADGGERVVSGQGKGSAGEAKDDASAETKANEVAADPCLTNNGGCSSAAYCQVRDAEVVCSECPREALDPDGECGPALEALAVAEGVLDPPFSARQRAYQVKLPLRTQRVSITARARAGATVQIEDGPPAETSQVYRSGLLPVGDASFDIVVRGAGEHERRYNIAVRREGTVSAYLKGDDTDAADNYGRALALASGRAAVGAFYADGIGNATPDVGAVYVYKREGDKYTQVDRLHPSAPERSAFFGSSLAMTDDALLVGMPYTRLPNESRAPGRVYVYARDGEQWNERAILQPDQGQPGDWFGLSQALDGSTLAIGAMGAGAVYIYEQIGGSWQFSQRLTDGTTNSANAHFGADVALQGDTLVVGAPDSGSGEAHVFERDATGTFAGHQLLDAGAARAKGFGTAVSLYGKVIAVGAPGTMNLEFAYEGSDEVYIFDRADDKSWRARPQPLVSKQTDNSSFGVAVHLLSESALAVGASEARATGDIFGSAPGGGAVPITGGVYLFADLGDEFVFDRLLNAPQPGEADWFGYVLASDGDLLGITAIHEGSNSRMVDGDAADNSCNQCGAAYIFE